MPPANAAIVGVFLEAAKDELAGFIPESSSFNCRPSSSRTCETIWSLENKHIHTTMNDRKICNSRIQNNRKKQTSLLHHLHLPVHRQWHHS